MKKNEILAAIAALKESFNAQLEALESMLVVESSSEEFDEECGNILYVAVVEDPLPEPEVEKVYSVQTYTPKEEGMYANQILLKKDFTDWCIGKVASINIHLKALPPKESGQKPYVLWKQGIYEIDAYDINGKKIGTSPQFKLDSLGQDIVMFLRRVGIGGYDKKTYKPKSCLLCCY